MVSYSEETGTTYRNWQGSGFRKYDATIEVIVSPKFSAADTQKLIQVMSRLHENFMGNPLAIENQKESAETLLREIANKDQIDLGTLRLAAEICQKYNFPEKKIQELAKMYPSNLRQTAEDLQTLQTLISSGAILRFRIIKAPQKSADLQYVLAGDDETGYMVATSREDTLAILQDKYRVPGGSSPAARFKRRAPRFASPQKLVVAFKENDAWVEAEAHNISLTGLLIETGRSISAYKRIKLRLKNTMTSEDVFVSGRIVRRDESGKMQGQALARFGIAFEKKLPEHPRAFLQFEEVEAGV